MIKRLKGIGLQFRVSQSLNNCSKHSSRPAQVPVYEMADVPPGQDESSIKPENHRCHPEQEDDNIEQFILKQEQAKGFPHEYPTPTITKLNQKAGQDQFPVADEENTYQPLIPPPPGAMGDEKSQYQSLTLKTCTLPAKFDTSPMESAPPAIPPRPKAV